MLARPIYSAIIWFRVATLKTGLAFTSHNFSEFLTAETAMILTMPGSFGNWGTNLVLPLKPSVWAGENGLSSFFSSVFGASSLGGIL